MAHDQLALYFDLRRHKIHRKALTISFSSRKDKFFLCGDQCVSRRERSLICYVSASLRLKMQKIHRVNLVRLNLLSSSEITRNNQVETLSLLGGDKLQQVCTVSHLGLTLASTLKWSDHVSGILKRAAACPKSCCPEKAGVPSV